MICSDDHLYNGTYGLAKLIDRATVRLVNSSSSLDKLHEGLRLLDLTNDERLRPSWDQYFMRLASLAAQRSNCMKRRVGCVLVREKRVISTGYNGTPRNLKNCNATGCKRSRETRYSDEAHKALQVLDATVGREQESVFPPVCVYTPKRMLFSRPDVSESEKEPSSIVIRKSGFNENPLTQSENLISLNTGVLV